MGVDRDLDAALVRPLRDRVVPRQHLVLEEVLRDPHQALGRDADVADVLDVEQVEQPLLQPLDRDVGHVAAGDHDVADARRASEVVEHRVPALVLLHLELVLQDLGRVVAHQVHPRAVAAVLGARRDQLGEHLGRVAVREPLDRPHVGLVQRVTGGHRVGRELLVAVGQRGGHVAANGVGPQVGLVHRVDHLGREQHRHRRPLLLVALDVRVQVVGQQVAEGPLELHEVLDRVGALPLRRLPLLLRDVAEPGQARPVGFDVLAAQRVFERLIRRVRVAGLVLGAARRSVALLAHPHLRVREGPGSCFGECRMNRLLSS